jgi:hypothetical protein
MKNINDYAKKLILEDEKEAQSAYSLSISLPYIIQF